jgi:modulator of FtsH protease HflK
MRATNPNALTAIWWDDMGRILTHMKDAGRLDLLDHHLAADELDITMSPVLPKGR